MNVEMLRYFRYVAKYKNITSAAQHLYISQSTLSRQIMALEEELGVKLFERNNKQMCLTQAGKVFYDDSEGFALHMQTIIKNVKAAGEGNTGILRITLPLVLQDVLYAPLAAMKAEHPGVEAVLEAYDFNEIPSAVRHSLYDLGVTYDFASFYDNAEEQRSLKSIPLREEVFCLLVPAKYGGSHPREAMQKMMDRMPLLTPAHVEPPFLKVLLSELQSYLHAKIITSRRMNTTESVFMNVSAGLGFALIPDAWRDYYGARKEVAFIPLTEIPQAKCTVVLLSNPANISQAAANFIRLVEENHSMKIADNSKQT